MVRETTRRDFLKAAGVTAAGLTCAPLLTGCGREASIVGEPRAEARTGERWTILVDLEKCQRQDGCDDCIVACHQEHNVPAEAEGNRDIKWLWKADFSGSFPDLGNEYAADEVKGGPVLVACNHCDNPPCVKVCPTQATWKRDDGVVMMDQHRCIGCRYCMAGCPYGSRSFNWKDPYEDEAGNPTEVPNPDFPKRSRGVVEKCNLCAERLAKGLGPKCVEACPHGALTFGDAADPDSEVRKLLASRYSIRRRLHLGTEPHIFYLV
jgi:molybdopterin-containing oxidoreductase family iron-sulfur binding subunit